MFKYYLFQQLTTKFGFIKKFGLRDLRSSLKKANV